MFSLLYIIVLHYCIVTCFAMCFSLLSSLCSSSCFVLLFALRFAFNCIPLYFITCYCISLHGISFHYMALHFITWHCISLHGIAFDNMALHLITWHCISLHGITIQVHSLFWNPSYYYLQHKKTDQLNLNLHASDFGQRFLWPFPCLLNQPTFLII